MSWIDWTVMIGTILVIALYGIWKSRGNSNLKGYFLADNKMKWWTIGLSIMATQASAITFLSTPGQAFNDGMRFVQFYFGVPVAMVIISIVIIPIYRRLNVYTAYEYLEGRFDLKTRTLGAILFLISRGLATGITIVAPAIILDTILGWDINITCIAIGIVVMIYTIIGGSKAVGQTQQQQMAVILFGMVVAGIVMVFQLPPEVSFFDAVSLAGGMGKLNTITLPSSGEEFIKDRYNLLSGLIAGSFLALSYFGTDQSQVQRYLGGKSLKEIRIGLLFNGMFKVPMQFMILFVGVMLFVFYQFQAGPMFFNQQERAIIVQSEYGDQYQRLENQYDSIHVAKRNTIMSWLAERKNEESPKAKELMSQIQVQDTTARFIRKQGIDLLEENNPDARTNDLDRVFLTFVLNHLPIGLVGLLMAVIFSAAMSSTSAELNALASTTMVDIYKRVVKKDGDDGHYLLVSKGLTFFWGVLAIIFAITAGHFENLIQYVNILGSLFYGTILGLFMVAFFFKKIGGTAVFIGGCVAEFCVLCLWGLPLLFPDSFGWLDIGFLWFNLIGCIIVIAVATIVETTLTNKAS